MNTKVGMCIWGFLSIITVVFMGKRTNLKAMQILNEQEKLTYTKYTLNPISITIWLFIVTLSLCDGYVVAVKAVSDIAWLELTVSYICLLSAAMIDYKLHIISNMIVFLLIGSRTLILLYEIFSGIFLFVNFLDSVLGCVLCFLLLIIADKIFPGGIGKGDIKLLSGLGFSCGTYTVFSTLLLSLICCIIMSIILLLMKRVSLKDSLPFGPFIWMGYICMILFAY